MPLFVKNDIEGAPIEEKFAFAIEFAKAIKTLHDAGRIHNDLHLGNVCWNKKDKICHTIDFGSITRSDHLEEISSYAVPRMILHRPPEAFAMMNFKSGDIYAYGCILHSLFQNTAALKNEKFANFITKLQHPWWFKRPSLQEVITFLQNNQAELEKIEEKEQSLDKDTAHLCLCHKKIDNYKKKINLLEEQISQAKMNVNKPKGFLILSLLSKKLALYRRYISGLYNIINPTSWCHAPLKEVEKRFQAGITKYKLFKSYKLNLSLFCNINIPTGGHNSVVPGLNLEMTPLQEKRYLANKETQATSEKTKNPVDHQKRQVRTL
jgi:serine/threonine protein kinase